MLFSAWAGLLKANPGLAKFFILIYDPANWRVQKKPGPFVPFSTSRCRRFGRESVSYTDTNWQESFDLIHDYACANACACVARINQPSSVFDEPGPGE